MNDRGDGQYQGRGWHVERPKVKLKLRHGSSYVYEAEFVIYIIKGCDVVLGKRWIRESN
jgi:hypothetical protein